MTEKAMGSGAGVSKLVAQAIDIARTYSYVTHLPTTVTPICHTTFSLLDANKIIAIVRGREVPFETKYSYRNVDGTDLNPSIFNFAGCTTYIGGSS